MKKTILFILTAGLVGHGALAGVVTKDPGFTSSVMLADFNGVTDRSYGLTRLAHDSTGAGLGNYSYAAGQGGNEAYAWFYSDPVPPSTPTWDPDVHQNIRVRMSSDRDVGESGLLQVFAWGPVVVEATVAAASAGTTLGEFSFALDPAGLPGLDGRTVRVDPFNYENNSGTDYWTVDYIMADVGVSRGAEMDSDADTNRFVTTGIDSIAISNSIYSGTATSTDPNLHIFSGVYVDADFYNYVEIRMKADAGSQILWFWRTDTSVSYVAETMETSGDGEWHTYLIDMSGEPDWTGILTANRLDPTHLSGTDFEVDYVRFLSVLPPDPLFGYEAWAAGWGVGIGAETEDPDNDGLSNLYEFGLDGDPTNEFDQGTSPIFGVVEVDGTNIFSYIHPQRSDPDSGLAYSLALATDLVAADWVTNTGYIVTGTNDTDGTLDFVTNATDMVASQKFIRLIVE